MKKKLRTVLGPFEKIADNLFAVTCTDYDPDFSNQSRDDLLGAGTAGCSAVRMGAYLGRNLDLPAGDHCEVVVRVPAAEGRYASVAVLSGMPQLTEEALLSGSLSADVLGLLPVSVCDGINEKGLAAEVNVVMVEDLRCPTTGTNPGKPDLNLGSAVRYLLDNAASAREAVALLRERNMRVTWDWSGLTAKGMEFHYMIADPRETFVVEFVNNEMVVLENARVMTNYYLSVPGLPHRVGTERADILRASLGEAVSAEGMGRLMEKVFYTRVHRGDLAPFCWSDHFGLHVPDGTEITGDNYLSLQEEVRALAARELANAEYAMRTGENPGREWITMHTSVYDLPARELRVCVHQRAGEWYTFRPGA